MKIKVYQFWEFGWHILLNECKRQITIFFLTLEECSPDQLLVLFVISWWQCTCTLLLREAFWNLFWVPSGAWKISPYLNPWRSSKCRGVLVWVWNVWLEMIDRKLMRKLDSLLAVLKLAFLMHGGLSTPLISPLLTLISRNFL